MRLFGKLLALFGLLFAVISASPSALALEVPPTPTVPVVDQTGTLTQEQVNSLVQKIEAQEKSTGNEIAILMVKSLEGEALEDYSIEVGRKWGIGQEDRNSGVLLFIAKDDRKLRIEVGYGLEGALTDARAGRIIQDRITPEFKNGNYYKGIDSGVDGIIAAINNEADPNLNEGDPALEDSWTDIVWLVLFLPIWLGSILARTKSWWAGGVLGLVIALIIGFFYGLFFGMLIAVILIPFGLFFDWAVSRDFQRQTRAGRKPSWWAGGAFLGGGGSGGSGGFGGGSFGGGGSSGSW